MLSDESDWDTDALERKFKLFCYDLFMMIYLLVDDNNNNRMRCTSWLILSKK